MEWISVKERLPESRVKVIAILQSKTFPRYKPITILAHIGEHEQTTDDYDWRDCECDTEYDEEKDCYWVKECWYEVNEVDDNPNWIIDSDYDVTHWMPMPEPPKADETCKQLTNAFGVKENATVRELFDAIEQLNSGAEPKENERSV